MMQTHTFSAVFFLAFACQEALAQGVVVNSQGGFPVEKALVIGENGEIAAVTDSAGRFDTGGLAEGEYTVWHTAFLAPESRTAGEGGDTLRLVPYMQKPVMKGVRDETAEYVKLRGWVRNMQFNDRRLAFMTDGIAEFFVPLEKGGKTKSRTEGLRHYMAEGQRSGYDASRDVKLYASVALASPRNEMIAQNGQCALRRAKVSETIQGTQQDLTTGGLCFVSLPDIFQSDYTFRFFKVKVNCEYQALSQSYAPCRTDGGYSLADLLASHCHSSFQTAVSAKKEHIDIISGFYVTEVEFLTKQEAKRQWKQGDSGEAVARPATVPPLCEALQKARDGMTEAE